MSYQKSDTLTTASPVLLTPRETEEILKQKRTFLWHLEKAGEITAVTLRRRGNVSGSKRYLKDSVDAYIQRMIDEAAGKAVAA